MIGHIHAMFKEWGDAKRRILRGSDRHPTHPKIDGWAQSFAGKVMEDHVRAGAGNRDQHYPEVFEGTALDIARALKGADEALSNVAYVHYVLTVPVKRKVVWYGESIAKPVSLRDYWATIDRLHYWTAGRLDVCTKKAG